VTWVNESFNYPLAAHESSWTQLRILVVVTLERSVKNWPKRYRCLCWFSYFQAATPTGMGTGNIYSCGPLNSTFSPERSKVCLVEFQFVGQGCEQHVYDFIQPDQRIP
jgi:hypothetical protein